MARPHYVSLFTGIGGFDLGLDRAGMECAGQCEIDDACVSVLERWWPGMPRVKDVRDVRRGSYSGAIDLVCGGFPCQDVSVAGKREGLAGERSGLWFEFHRVLAELEPRWVIVENVPGLLSSNGGRDFAAILQGLVELGYGVVWRVLDAQYDNLAQRRERVFVVGHLGDGRAAEVLFESEGGAWDPPPSREKGAQLARPLAASTTLNHYDESQQSYIVSQCHGTNVGEFGTLRRGNGHVTEGVPFVAFDRTQSSVSGDVTGPLRACGARTEGVNDAKADAQCVAFAGMSQAGGGWAPPSCPTSKNLGLPLDTTRAQCVAMTSPCLGKESYSPTKSSSGQMIDFCIGSQYGVRRLTPTECERLQGFPDGWTAGQSDSRRYRQLGNAVAVPVAEWIGRQLMAVLYG